MEDLIRKNKSLRGAYRIAKAAAEISAPVLIEGETGTGKELFANAIHRLSIRRNAPFTAVNCPCVPETIFESEMFGHERGSFTGADRQHIGKFEQTGTGTIFLDEVCALDLRLQAKLLRVIQEREFTRIGGKHLIPMPARIIAAANQDLQEMVKAGLFRRDLYYRLSVIPIYLPPLRQRKTEIPALIDYFIDKYNTEFERSTTGFTQQALDACMAHDWPGNVRELEHVVLRAVALGRNPTIDVGDLPTFEIPEPDCEASTWNLEEETSTFRKRMIIDALEKTHWHYSRTADLLGVHRNTLFSLVRKYDLYTKNPRRPEYGTA